MNRGDRRRAAQNSGRESEGKHHPRVGSAAPWIAGGLFFLLVGGIWLGLRSVQGNHHPEPRPGITGETAIPASAYVGYARVSAVYSHAAEVAAVLGACDVTPDYLRREMPERRLEEVGLSEVDPSGTASSAGVTS